ncbi:MAG TPA: hypothetical protein VGY56_06685 [Verrucomicrobiae bacterium]|nr:hypothetical protein [Verrucomicrobiae bacterium]
MNWWAGVVPLVAVFGAMTPVRPASPGASAAAPSYGGRDAGQADLCRNHLLR